MFEVVVIDPALCNLIQPPNLVTEYIYKIGDPNGELDFSGIEAGTCSFSYSMTKQNGDPMDWEYAAFVKINPTFVPHSTVVGYYEIVNLPGFLWITTDVANMAGMKAELTLSLTSGA